MDFSVYLSFCSLISQRKMELFLFKAAVHLSRIIEKERNCSVPRPGGSRAKVLA